MIREILEEYSRKNIAIGQFNFSTIDQLKGIARAGKEKNVSVICGTSQGEANFLGMREASSLIKAIKEEGGSLFLNFDHGEDVETLKRAIDLGYDMVHFDGGKLSLKENIEKTREVVNYARRKKVLVEGEVSEIGGKSTVSDEKIDDFSLTSLEEIVKFIKETDVDLIALDIGNVHGIHKGSPLLKLERINLLLEQVSCFVTLHGGSGIDDSSIKEAISRGVVKININTELRLSWRNSLKKFIEENPKEITPYKILSSSEKNTYLEVSKKIDLFLQN